MKKKNNTCLNKWLTIDQWIRRFSSDINKIKNGSMIALKSSRNLWCVGSDVSVRLVLGENNIDLRLYVSIMGRNGLLIKLIRSISPEISDDFSILGKSV